MPTELPKQYDPHEAQQRWLAFWDERGYFHSEPDADASRSPSSFRRRTSPAPCTWAMPSTTRLQDVLIRWRRMQGFNALWMPGTDHAGIATQAVVERRIREEEKKTRHDLGREELVQPHLAMEGPVRDAHPRPAARTRLQLRLAADALHARCRSAPGPCGTTFFKMFQDGLIFRGKRLVNWDTYLQTAVADDETFDETIKGGFWTFRYPVKGDRTNSFASRPRGPRRCSATRPWRCIPTMSATST